MRVAKQFSLNDLHSSKADEFIINYSTANSYEKLVEFLQEYKDKTISIAIGEDVDIEDIIALLDINKNIIVRFTWKSDAATLARLKEVGLPYYYAPNLAATNFTMLNFLISNVGVSHVYIADDLCYNMKEVRSLCDESHVKLRIVLNRVPVLSSSRLDSPEAPFYFPEDYNLLDKYYDICEFDCYKSGEEVDNFDVLYNIWIKRHSWKGDLAQINTDITRPIVYDTYIPGFTEQKLTCGLSCKQGRPCDRCFQYDDLAQIVREKELSFLE